MLGACADGGLLAREQAPNSLKTDKVNMRRPGIITRTEQSRETDIQKIIQIEHNYDIIYI